MEHLVFKPQHEVTITCTGAKINKEFLFKMVSGIYDPDGYEYDYTIFDMYHKLDKILNL